MSVTSKSIPAAIRNLQYASNDASSSEARSCIGNVIHLLREMQEMGIGDLCEAVQNDWTNGAYDLVDRMQTLTKPVEVAL